MIQGFVALLPSFPSSYTVLCIVQVVLIAGVFVAGSYAEIDWGAYMQEVKGFLEGERDYKNLKGETGPLVYPAGFVYIYSVFYYLTDNGTNIVFAQCIFAVAFFWMQFIVFKLYYVARAPVFLAAILLFSKRLYSIFMLRMFNDGIAMLLLYFAIYLFIRNDFFRGCAVFSLAVSVKMNVLLFAPGLLVILLHRFSLLRVVGLLSVCAGVQLILGLPFLVAHPVSYLTKAFELSRVFTQKWSVNYQFLPEWWFVSPNWGYFLLVMTLTTWAYMYWVAWRRRDLFNPTLVILTLFESNLIGIVFSRTFHYQFYVWFFHQIPLVMYYSTASWFAVLASVIATEVAFNVYPPTPHSSGILMFQLVCVLFGVLLNGPLNLAGLRRGEGRSDPRKVAASLISAAKEFKEQEATGSEGKKTCRSNKRKQQ